MSWIRVDQDLPDHRKSIELGIILNDDRAWTYVVQLWLWAARLEGDGNLTGVKPIVIARRAGWQGDPDEFINALRQVKFLDGFVLHDWTEYQAQRAEQARDRERKRLKRLKPSDGLPADTAGREPDTAGQNPPIPESPAPTGTGTSTRTGTKTKTEERLSSADDGPAQVSLIETAPPKAKRDREAEVTRVLVHWRSIHATPASAIEGKAGEKRRVRVRARLNEGTTADECILALDGALKDPWLMGTDPKSTKAYRDVDTILRDRLQIEKLIGLVLPAGPRSQIASTGQRGAFPTPGVGSVREERAYSKPVEAFRVEWSAENELARIAAMGRWSKSRTVNVPWDKEWPADVPIPEGYTINRLPKPEPVARLQDLIGAPIE